MSIKKVCLLFVVLVVFASGLFIAIHYSSKEEIHQLDDNKESTIEIINEKEIDIAEEVDNTNVEKQEEVKKEIKEEVVKEEKEVENKTTKQENNTDNNTPVIEELPVAEEVIETPSCTPKKFVWSWVVPEFSSESSCEAKGNTFIPEYGYQCDSYQDDCGDYYYMLRLFDDNQHLIDWHTIEN